MENKQILSEGAGILPFSIDPNGKLKFLFHKTFEGKKVGYLIDFGGAVENEDVKNGDLLQAAVREFCEETAGLLNSEDIENDFKKYFLLKRAEENQNDNFSEEEIQSNEFVKNSVKYCYEKISNDSDNIFKTSCDSYTLFLIKINYFEVEKINKIFETNFKKKREFVWTEINDILNSSDNKILNQIYPRVRYSKNFLEIIKNINILNN
jgi:hypothetical protein